MIASISVPLRAFLTPSMPSFTLATVLASALSPKSLITFSAWNTKESALFLVSTSSLRFLSSAS